MTADLRRWRITFTHVARHLAERTTWERFAADEATARGAFLVAAALEFPGEVVRLEAVDLVGDADPDLEAADEYVEHQAQRWVREILANRDPSLTWRDAGYASPEAAAEALVGDYQHDPAWRRTVALVAAVLAADTAKDPS